MNVAFLKLFLRVVLDVELALKSVYRKANHHRYKKVLILESSKVFLLVEQVDLLQQSEDNN